MDQNEPPPPDDPSSTPTPTPAQQQPTTSSSSVAVDPQLTNDNLPWYKRYQGSIIAILLLVIIGLVAAIVVVVVGQNNSNENDTVVNPNIDKDDKSVAGPSSPPALTNTTAPTSRPTNSTVLAQLDNNFTSSAPISSPDEGAVPVTITKSPVVLSKEPTRYATDAPSASGPTMNDLSTNQPTMITQAPVVSSKEPTRYTTDAPSIPSADVVTTGPTMNDLSTNQPTMITKAPVVSLKEPTRYTTDAPFIPSADVVTTGPIMNDLSTNQPTTLASFDATIEVFPRDDPTMSPSPTKSINPTPPVSNDRFLQILAKLEPLSGDALTDRNSPQYRAAKWISDADPIPNYSFVTGGTGLNLDDPGFEQRYVMALFYFALDGPNWSSGGSGWLGEESVCEWYGVKGNSDGCTGGCIERSDYVGDYDRVCRIAMGKLNSLFGQIPSELGYLSEMRWFEIQEDYLFGTIPDALGTGWTKLHTFLVGHNFLHGGFPPTFQNNEMLGTIFVDGNMFNGTFPSVFGTLKNLEWLDAENNAFVGELPAGIGNLKSLRILNVNNNNMTGTLPDTWDENNLIEDFEVADNTFAGPLPPSLGKVKFLKDFRASRNKITGSLPEEYYKFQDLEELYLDENQMSGVLPQTDEPFYDGLQELSIHSNEFSGRFPVENFEDTFRLKVLSLHGNQLTGTITPNICARLDPSRAYTRLNELTVECGLIECECCTCYENGQLISTSPPFPAPISSILLTDSPTLANHGLMIQDADFGRPTRAPNSLLAPNRDDLGIQEQIEGTILQRSATFNGMDENDPRYLAMDWILHIDERQVTVDDDNLSQRYVIALVAFSLDSLAWYACGEHRDFDNGGEEFVVEDCEVWNMATSQYESHKIWLSRADECHWYGVICSNDGVVRGVELIGNDLVGLIPPEISQLHFLQYLALNGNCLYGTIPPEIGMMPDLRSLELHGNGLSGELPAEFSNASKLELLNVALQYGFDHVCYMSNGTYVNTLFEQGGLYGSNYNPGLSGRVLEPKVDKWASLKGLQLFDNSFSGTISEDIEDLKELVFFRAHNNVFSGYLPAGLTNLKKVREVYLHKNQIYLDIPPQIGDMENLEDLRLHENEMFDDIPDSLYSIRKLKYLWLQDTVHCEEVQEGGYECSIDSDFGFTGTISTKIGNLDKLQQLLINNNPISGIIPTEIGLCENLALLHIHKTNIVGSAPIELCLLREKSLNSENDVGVFYADCRPNNKTQAPFFACDCCSDCCDHTTKVCIADD